MDKQELQLAISSLRKNANKQNAYFGIFDNGAGKEESFIAANKQGLELFALEILLAIQEADRLSKDKKNSPHLSLNLDEDWIDETSSTFINYIEFTDSLRNSDQTSPDEEGLKDTLIRFGCVGILLFILLSIIIGSITIFKWLF